MEGPPRLAELSYSPSGLKESLEPPAVPSSAPSQLQPATERKIEGRKPHILWPKYSQKNEQETIDADLVILLENPKGPVEDY